MLIGLAFFWVLLIAAILGLLAWGLSAIIHPRR